MRNPKVKKKFFISFYLVCTQLLLMITFFIYNLNAKRKRRCEKKMKKIQQTKKLYFFVISPSKETSSQQEKKNWSVEFREKRNLFSSTFPLNHPINLRGLRWWVCDRRNFANWETNIKEYILPYQLLLFLNFWYEKGWSEIFFSLSGIFYCCYVPLVLELYLPILLSHSVFCLFFMPFVLRCLLAIPQLFLQFFLFCPIYNRMRDELWGYIL